MEKKTIEAEKKPSVKIDERLNKQDEVILFPRKVEQAKREIAEYGLPDIVKKKP